LEFTLLLSVIVIFCVWNNVYAQDKSYTSEVRNGVTFISNKKTNLTKNDQIQLRFVRTIGSLTNDDENLQFFLPENIIKDKKGNYFILDGGNYKLKKFDKDWNFLMSFGEQGQGPGEFKWPVTLQYDKVNNLLYIFDRSDNSLTSFTTEGKLINKLRPERLNGYFYLLDENRYISSANTILSSNYGKNYVEEIFAVNGFDKTDHFKFAIPEFVTDKYTTKQVNVANVALDNQKNIYLAYSYFNKIQKYDDRGKLLLEIDRPLNYKVNFERSTNTGDNINRGFAGQVKKKTSVSKGLSIDAHGRIWVVTFNRQLRQNEIVSLLVTQNLDGERAVMKDLKGNTDIFESDAFVLEVFNDKGILLTQITLDKYVDRIDIIDNHLFLLDQMRSGRYYVYEILEK